MQLLSVNNYKAEPFRIIQKFEPAPIFLFRKMKKHIVHGKYIWYTKNTKYKIQNT